TCSVEPPDDLDASTLSPQGGSDGEPNSVPRDACALGVQLDADPDVPRTLDQHVHEIRIERFQWSPFAMDDRDARPRARGDVSELERDVATADERDPSRQGVEAQELLARREPLGAGKLQGGGHRPGGDEEAAADAPV